MGILGLSRSNILERRAGTLARTYISGKRSDFGLVVFIFSVVEQQNEEELHGSIKKSVPSTIMVPSLEFQLFQYQFPSLLPFDSLGMSYKRSFSFDLLQLKSDCFSYYLLLSLSAKSYSNV